MCPASATSVGPFLAAVASQSTSEIPQSATWSRSGVTIIVADLCFAVFPPHGRILYVPV